MAFIPICITHGFVVGALHGKGTIPDIWVPKSAFHVLHMFISYRRKSCHSLNSPTLIRVTHGFLVWEFDGKGQILDIRVPKSAYQICENPVTILNGFSLIHVTHGFVVGEFNDEEQFLMPGS